MMQVYLGNDIKVINPDPSLVAWSEKYLTVRNAEYDKRSRLGYSTYKCPENVSFYQEQGGATNKILILPYGTWSYIGETVLKIAKYQRHSDWTMRSREDADRDRNGRCSKAQGSLDYTYKRSFGTVI